MPGQPMPYMQPEPVPYMQPEPVPYMQPVPIAQPEPVPVAEPEPQSVHAKPVVITPEYSTVAATEAPTPIPIPVPFDGVSEATPVQVEEISFYYR